MRQTVDHVRSVTPDEQEGIVEIKGARETPGRGRRRSGTPGNLLPELTTFVGREREVRQFQGTLAHC
jgi:hypothetical protein